MKECPGLSDILRWYKNKLDKELSIDVSTEEVAPLIDGKLLTQKISADVGFIRDHFTLQIIEQLLKQYKKVLVVYGAGHFITLRQSLDAAFGMPKFQEGTASRDEHE